MSASPARLALDELLRLYPALDVVEVDWQRFDGQEGPWVVVALADPQLVHWKERFAIWKRTGALHAVDRGGAVIDPPIWTPEAAAA